MRGIAVSALLLSGEVLAHPGHGALPVHVHEWEYALLAIAVIAAAIGWITARK